MQRSTKERAYIQAVLEHATKPLTVSEIKKLLRTPVHTATVYRALDDLVASGVVRRVELGGRSAHYERSDEHHHHIVCTSCGDIEDVQREPAGLERRALIGSKKFTSIRSHSLEFFGVCKRCV